MLTDKLAAYGFILKSFRWIYTCLSNRIERLKVSNEYRSQEGIQEIIFDKLQKFLCDLSNFIGDEDIASYEDNSRAYRVNKVKELVIHELEKPAAVFLKINSDKGQLLIS